MKVRLGDYIKEYSVRNKEEEDIAVYSVTNTKGFCSEYFSKDVASKNRSTYKIVPRGYFAYNPSRINVGSIDFLRDEAKVIVSPLYVVFEITSSLDNQYLLYYLKSDISLHYIKELATGSVRDNLKFSILSDFPIELRTPDEQISVVNTLKGIESLIALYQSLLRKLDELVKARFIEMFGDEARMDRWPCCRIGDVAEVSVGVVIKPAQYYTDDSDNGIPAFRSLNIGEMYIKDNNWVYFTSEGNAKNKKSILRENDLAIVRSGAPGTACVITEQYSNFNAIDIIIARPNTEKINPVFLCAFTNYPHGKKQIKAGTGGAAQQHFNVGKYKEMTLIKPPMPLQEEFAAFVTQVDKSRTVVQQALDKTQQLFDSLMQQYFA